MKKLFVFSFIICISLAITTRDQSHLRQQSHFLDGQLCKKSGGFVCGFVNKDCCKIGCDSKVFGMNEECTKGQHLDLSKAPDCKELCEKSNGTLFKSQLLGDDQCCKTKSLVDNKCPEDAKIDISACGKGTLAGKFVGFISHNFKKL